MATGGRRIGIGCGAAMVLTLIASGQGWAATTAATFTVNGGSLSISVPGNALLGSAATGTATLSAHLGAVSVTDQRGLLASSWTATVQGTDFKTGGQTAQETIARGQVSYWSGPATASSGYGTPGPTFTAGQLASANKVTLASQRTAFSASTVGANSAAWNPTIVITIPGSAVAGTYAGTITHSVA